MDYLHSNDHFAQLRKALNQSKLTFLGDRKTELILSFLDHSLISLNLSKYGVHYLELSHIVETN